MTSVLLYCIRSTPNFETKTKCEYAFVRKLVMVEEETHTHY